MDDIFDYEGEQAAEEQVNKHVWGPLNEKDSSPLSFSAILPSLKGRISLEHLAKCTSSSSSSSSFSAKKTRQSAAKVRRPDQLWDLHGERFFSLESVPTASEDEFRGVSLTTSSCPDLRMFSEVKFGPRQFQTVSNSNQTMD
jgi:hypothetical protein